jgi:hypothetical protein
LLRATLRKETNVTLIVNGLLISGSLTSEDQYLTHLAMPKNWRSNKRVSALFLAKVKCVGVDANAAQVKRGMAWVYRQYARDQNLYILEHDAKAERRGLWIDISLLHLGNFVS